MAEMEKNEYRDQRLANMGKLEGFGHKPFGRAYNRTGNLAEIRKNYKDELKVSVAGRLVTIRSMGKSIFADIRDGSGKFQVYAQKNALGEQAFDAFKLLDVGDHIGIEGLLFTTHAGEPTIKIEKWVLLSKALLPLPEKWHGLKDVEARYRQRYLDLIANPEVRELFNKRTMAIREIRNYLFEKGFMEVETPMMQSMAGGAAARPFVTRYTALDTDMFLRIAPELYLKRLLVGGFDKVFELNRNFRNEGLSRTHNPEFTMLEIYEAYSDVKGMKELVEGLITNVAQKVFGGLQVKFGEHMINLAPPWREVPYRDLITAKMGSDWYGVPVADARRKAEELGLAIDPSWNHLMVTHEIYEKTIEKTLIQPTFVTRLPADLVPLAKACEDDPACVDVFELEIAGYEIAPGYTEMNDPLEQRKRLEAQAGGAPIDEEFITALEHGMPPAGGMGIGIDRLMMVLSGMEAIRDVILFPQLRPRA
ncbi:MAG: lysine--tRNA ligase [Kiritimatiellae bacterium]|nr:lysine--tRNA ligase [Kiritimatiellia bacterium]MDD5523180.1 lysine--tRNA ligase [Kiritimatiellia bacterium]